MQSLTFPPGFRFGIADADLQTIGEDNTRKFENSEETMWNRFAATSGKCYENATPGIGIDRYHKWAEDIEIMKAMGVKHYRTSISIARLLKRNGEVNTEALKWYTTYFKALKQAGIHIYATLYHWELPQFLYEEGGWKSQKTIQHFLKHAETVVTNLGEYIDEYVIVNEPWCISILSHYLGAHAPGKQDLQEALLISHNILLTIGLTYQRLVAIDPKLKITTVFNSEPSYAFSTKEKDRRAARYGDEHFNRWFMDPLFLGKYPEFMAERYGKAMPKVSEEDMKTIKIGDKLHAFAINYYCGKIAQSNDSDPLGFKTIVKEDGPKNDLGWPVFIPPVYPEGLYDMLQQVYFSYKDHGLKRIYILENGMALKSSWNGKDSVVQDDARVNYFEKHISQIHNAIIRGVPIEAYFAWTFMDNYEWAEGYKPESCFGMIHVDRKTMKRVWKKSAHWYSKLLKTNKLTL